MVTVNTPRPTDDTPPLVRSWGVIYLIVLLVLAAVIVGLYILGWWYA